MVRKKLSAKGAKDFMKKPVAKKKLDRKAGDRHAENVAKSKRPSSEYVDPKQIGGGALRGVMEETMARVYEEMWPTMTTHESDTGNVDVEIKEECYILSLTMVCGNDDYKPRKGLKIREHNFKKQPKMCKEHS